MDEKMEFPNTLDEFIRQYSFIDEEQIYTNGIELIPVFRIRQWEEHKKEENQELKKQLSNSHQIKTKQKEFIEWLEKETKIIENKLNKYNELVKRGKETDIEYYLSIIDERIFDIYGKILSKYKEIIGCKE